MVKLVVFVFLGALLVGVVQAATEDVLELRALAVGSGVVLYWSGVEDAASYVVYRGGAVIVEINGTNHFDEEGRVGSRYWIQAYSEQGELAASNVAIAQLAPQSLATSRLPAIITAAIMVALAILVLAFRLDWLRSPRRVIAWCSSNQPPDWLSYLLLRLMLVAKPGDAQANGALGDVHLRQGHLCDALRCYVQAYAVTGPDCQRGAATYLAARVNARLDRPSDAGRWLILALDLDRNLLDGARLDPDFAGVQHNPQFRRRVGAGYDFGIDADAP